MTVAELRKKLEQFGAGREVLVGIELHGCRSIGDIKLDGDDEKVVIHGLCLPAADIRFPG